MPVEIPITSETVPSPLDCVVSNADWQSLIGLLTATFPNDATVFLTGNTEPDPSEREFPWFRTNADGTPDKWYKYANGSWLSRHPTAAGTVIMWEGDEADIPTFDGGEAGAVTGISGPMWERVTEMNARFPVGPGTFPSGAILNVGDTGGEEKHSLTLAEMPPHTHGPKDPFTSIFGRRDPGGDRNTNEGQNGGFTDDILETVGGSGDPKVVEAHNNIPPFRAVWFLRKTARTHYRL